MKHTVLILTALLALTACQKKAETTTGTDTPAAETPATDPATETPTTETPDTDSETAEAETPATAAAAATTPGAVPAGYTEVPGLTEEPKRDFTAAPDLALTGGAD